VDYNFFELPPGSISGYVFVDGPPLQTVDGSPPANWMDLRDGQRTAVSRPIAGVVMELRHGLNGEPISADQALPGAYADGPIRVVTDAQGYYVFHSLPRGNYAVYQVHPDGYVDGIDTPGTTSGIAFNGDTEFLRGLIERLAKDPAGDAIVQIPLGAGAHSLENNFSEILVERILVPPVPPPPAPPVWQPAAWVVPPAVPWLFGPLGLPPVIPSIPVYGASGEPTLTWHLSVVDGGMPRGNAPDIDLNQGRWRTISYLQHTQWISVALNRGYWSLPSSLVSMATEEGEGLSFGIPGGIPLSGDWNGDGISQLGVFKDGHWFLDFNGNGRWDEGDLWAKLGGEGDLPIVGDWNGDGKDDIGIFGPQWEGDERAIEAEPGLPTAQNVYRRRLTPTHSTPKNLPPEPDEATDGHRVLKRTAHGDPRVDVIDHVFRFGVQGDRPVVGDWNGDGIRTIGIFRGGSWYLDIDGDGRFTERDVKANFGQPGDRPVVGDWNGDGIDQIGVFRQGMWYLDTNGNRELDAHDEVFRLGESGDLPVVGDWNGDGVDQPAVYRDAA
jgi:serine-aspartate repeat-containing protein C/D/E